MRLLMAFLVAGALGAEAQTVAPAFAWRGSLWASAVTQDRTTPDGSLALRPLEAGQSQLSLDGLMLGMDATLPQGWSGRATLLAGHAGTVVQATTGDTGSIAPVEAMLVWTGRRDTLRIGRMITFIGMESLDDAVDATASRGLLFTFADPFGQVGMNWHHAFTPVWSTDVWVFNGEDRVKDNNQGKTVGLGLTWNPGGSADSYLSLQAYRGPEQDGLGAAAHPGAEGRSRERLCLMGQWLRGRNTLQGEMSLGREPFPATAIRGASAPQIETWRGYGLILKRELGGGVSAVVRAERLEDTLGVRLAADASIGTSLGLDAGGVAYSGLAGAGLVARSFSLGLEKKQGAAFVRIEARQDHLNRDVRDAQGVAFRHSDSGTLSVGATF